MTNIELTKPKLTIALLAAGNASRFGSPKQLAYYQEQTFIDRSINILEAINCELLVITGAHHPTIYEHLCAQSKEHYVIYNPNWQQGMSSSIKMAVHHCLNNNEQYDGVMFITVDQILLTQKDIQSLIDNWYQDSAYIVCAEYANHKGIPAIFPKQYFSKLLDLYDDKGAKSLIKSSTNVNAVLLPNAELDIDTVEQLKAQNVKVKPC